MPRLTVQHVEPALKFNGTTNNVQTSLWSSSIINISMGAWFKSSNYTQNVQAIISNGDGSANAGTRGGFALVLSGNATTDGSMFLLDHGVAWNDCGFKVQDNNSHHIFLTIDGSNNFLVYLDGVLRFTGTNLVHLPKTNSYIGAVFDSIFVFNGLISEPRFYTSALSQADVTSLFNQQEASVIPTNLYRFNESTGIIAYDTGSSPKNGAILGAYYTTGIVTVGRTSI